MYTVLRNEQHLLGKLQRNNKWHGVTPCKSIHINTVKREIMLLIGSLSWLI